MRLKSKKVIVTGGASGIGRAICTVFAKEGASVVVADIDESGSLETLSQIQSEGGQATTITTDVSSEESVCGNMHRTFRNKAVFIRHELAYRQPLE